MLRHLGPEFKEMIPWALLLKDRLFYQKSYATLLWTVQKSQRKQCRLLWYQTCFFFASFPRISERIFPSLFNHRWKLSIFFYILDQSVFFRTVEYYVADVDHLQFSPNYFRPSYKPTTLLLSYKQFPLRAPSILYLALWYHVLNIHIRFYNDYVKSHDLINNSRYLPQRRRFQQRLFRSRLRLRRKVIYRLSFLRQSMKNRFCVIEFQALDLRREGPELTSVFDFNYFLPVVTSWRSQLALAARSLPLVLAASPRQNYLARMNVVQLNLWGNALLARDPLPFWQLIRMDWSHFLFSIPLFLTTFKFRLAIRKVYDSLRNRFVKRLFVEQRASSLNYPLLAALNLSQKALPSTRRFYFVWWTIDYRINRFWNWELIDQWCRIRAYSDTKVRSSTFPMNYLYYNSFKFQNEVLPTDAAFTNWLKISPFLTRQFLPLDFLLWRINSNQESYRRFLANGAFPLTTFYRKLTLDYYATFRYKTVRFFLENLIQRNGFYMMTGRTWLGQENNPWSLRKPYVRLPDGRYHPREPRWSMIRHFYTAATLKFILATFRWSPHLSLVSFFLLFDGPLAYPCPYRLARFFHGILTTVRAYRRHYHMYRCGSLQQFRRYPHKVYVSSRNDPAFRARWFSFADRMRRAGIKKSDLPYYPQDDELDMIRDLRQRFANAKWAKPAIYWIIR